MEPNADLQIRKKIRAAEELPVDWNSAWVWSRIETPARKNYRWLFYAAASLVLIGLITFYLMSLKYNKAMMDHLDQLSLQVDNLQMASPQEPGIASCDDSVAKQPNEPIVVSKAVLKRKESNQVAGIPVPTLNSMVSTTLPVASIEPIAVQIEEISQPTQPETVREIVPIIGKIPSAPSFPVTQSKESRVSVFKSARQEKSEITATPEYKILSARINH